MAFLSRKPKLDKANLPCPSKDSVMISLAADLGLREAVFCVNENGDVCFANSTALKLIGRKAEEILSFGISNVHGNNPVDHDWKSRWKEIKDKDGHLFTEEVWISRDGSRHPMEVSFTFATIDGQDMAIVVARDITERRGLVDSLHLAQERSRKYFELAGIIYLVLTVNGEIMDINESGCRILGCDKKNIIGKNWVRNFISSNDVGTIMEVRKSVASGSDKFSKFENRVITADGRELTVVWNNTVLKDDNGNVLAMLSAGMDVTEERRLTAEALAHQKRLNDVIEGLNMGVFRLKFDLKRRDFVMLEASPALLKICEMVSKDDMIGKGIEPFFVDSEDYRESLKKIMKDKQIRNLEIKMVTAEGREFWASINAVLQKEGSDTYVNGSVEDVTDMREAEKRIEESETRYNDMVNNITVGIFRSSFDDDDDLGRFTEVNPTIVGMLQGKSRETVLKRNLFSFYLDRKVAKRSSLLMKRAAEVGVSYRDEVEMETAKGRRFWAAVSISFKTDASGHRYGDGIIEDITMRKEADSALKWQSEISTRLAETSYKYIGSGDYESLIHSGLETAANMVSSERAVLFQISEDGKSFDSIHDWRASGKQTHGDDLKDIAPNEMKWSMGKILNGEVVRIGSRDDLPRKAVGERKMFEKSGASSFMMIPLPGDKKGISGALVLFNYREDRHWTERDISAGHFIASLLSNVIIRQEVAGKLSNSEKRLKEVIERVELGIARVADGSDARFVEFNDAVMKMFETDERNDLLNVKLIDLYADKSQYGSLMDKMHQSGKLDREQVHYRTLKGNDLWVEWTGEWVEGDESHEFFDGILSDITVSKRNEAKSKELDSLKNTFIQVVSHQVRTPLNSIRWSLETLMSEELGKLTQSQKDFLRVIYTSEIEILGRLNDILTAMDIEENRIVFRKAIFPIDNVWNSVMSEVSKRGLAKKITFNYRPPSSNLNVEGDMDKIQEVMRVFAENAVDYTPENGRIDVSITRTDGKIRFEITDNGIGIPKIEQDRLFTRFYRASNASSMKPDATGLGLAIANYYIKQHSGKIGFESHEGKGSKFWFEIPEIK